MADNNEIDSLKLGIEVGDLSSSDIKNIKDLSSSLAALDKVLSSEFMKNLETLSHLKINVNVSKLKQAAKQVQKAVAPTSASGTVLDGDVDIAEEKKRLQKEIKQRQQAIDSIFEESGKSAKDSAAVFIEKGVIEPEIKANEEQEKQISLWEKFKQKVKSVGEVIKKLGKAIVRVAIYRAIRAAIKGIVQTIRNGLQAFAEFSPKFEQTMTALTSAGRNFKMSFTAAFAPILESIAPALIQIVNSFTQLNNKLAETIAYLKGAGEYTKVNTEYQEQYNKAVNLLPFDKFNVLQQSSYGGFEKVAVDTEKMAKNAPKLGKIKAVITSFKETLKDVVATLGKAWEFIKSIFGECGDVILTFMKSNIDFSKLLWQTLGSLLNVVKVILNLDFSKSIIYTSLTLLSGVLTTIVGIAKTFLDILNSILNRDFSGFGERVKSYFNFGFTKKAKNAPKLGKIKAVITSFKETLKDVVATLGKAWEFIKSIFGECGDVILTFMKSNIDFSKLLWQTLGSLLNVVKVILNLDFSKSIIYTSLTLLSGVLTTIVGIAKTFLDILNSILNRDFSGFGERVKSYFNFGFTKNLWNRGRRGGFIKDFLKWKFHIGTYATGGLPDTGSLFLAGERGAELVTNVGSSQSAVMNMQQLQQAIYGGMVSALSTMQQVGGHETAQPITVKIGEDTLFEITRKSATRRGLDFAKV